VITVTRPPLAERYRSGPARAGHLNDNDRLESAMAERDDAPLDENASANENAARDDNWEASWETEDNYWHENFSSRPYSLGPDYYDRFRPAYRYGFDAGSHSMGRRWDDAEPDLRAGWERYEHRGESASTWDEIKDAVRDAWDRTTGRQATGRRSTDTDSSAPDTAGVERIDPTR
jgi:hypothetical protein